MFLRFNKSVGIKYIMYSLSNSHFIIVIKPNQQHMYTDEYKIWKFLTINNIQLYNINGIIM